MGMSSMFGGRDGTPAYDDELDEELPGLEDEA